MFFKKKKIFSIILFSVFLFSLFAFSASALELKYPTFGGQTIGEGTTLPQYVKYIFTFSIGIAGLLAFSVLVWGGALWLTSSGEPAKIGEAKTKILGALIGVVLILGSYLILTTINPDLINLTTTSTKAVTGIYLVTSGGKEAYFSQDSPYLTEDTNDPYTEVKFISPSEGKGALNAVYIYPENQYQGEAEKIDNSGGIFPISISSKKSILFLWNKPGVYLYSKTNYEGNPLYTQSSIRSLSRFNFDNKASSLDIKHDAPNAYYGVVLFTDNDYQGQCGLAMDSASNLSSPGGSYLEISNPVRAGTLSSLIVLNNANVSQGEVTFYDAIDCKGCKVSLNVTQTIYRNNFNNWPDIKQFTCPDGTKKDVDKNILSFEINGNFGVVLSNEPCLGAACGKDIPASPDVKCQFFSKPAGGTCITTLKGSEVYDAGFGGKKVRSLLVIPLMEKVIQ